MRSSQHYELPSVQGGRGEASVARELIRVGRPPYVFAALYKLELVLYKGYLSATDLKGTRLLPFISHRTRHLKDLTLNSQHSHYIQIHNCQHVWSPRDKEDHGEYGLMLPLNPL